MKTTRKALCVLGVMLAVSLLAIALIPASPVSAATSEARPMITEKRAEFRENRERNAALVRENRELRLSLKAQLTEIRGDLDKETLDGLKSIRVSLKSTVEELRATRGAIREAFHSNPESIPEIQQVRHQKLAFIHQLLQDMAKLVN